MKVIPAEQFIDVVEDVIIDREKQAKALSQSFIGVAKNEMLAELNKRIDDGWIFTKAHPKFTREDVDAVAKSRFYRKTGSNLFIYLIISMIGLAILTATFRVIPPFVYYSIAVPVAFTFLYTYLKKQREGIRELRQATNIMVGEPEKAKANSKK